MNELIRFGIKLGAITLVSFFGLYFLFSSGFIGGEQYYKFSAVIISFFLPLVYAGFGFYSVYKQATKEVPSFRTAFRYSFIPMLVAGILSTSVIFIWFNTQGQIGEEVLQNELVNNFERQIQGSEEQSKLEEDLQTMRTTDVNLFSLKYFFQFLLLLQLFYLILSAIFAMFMKNRRF